MENTQYLLQQVGVIKKNTNKTWIELKDKFKPAILNLDRFSHIIVLWWIHKRDTEEGRKTLQVHPRVQNEKQPPPKSGVFACRSPARPNPIGLTIVKLEKIDNNKIYIDRIDAIEDSPILDIKPYIPNSDCILESKLPHYFSSLEKKRIE
ncbi:MAG: tRNA (N6-threonylcarbamoyladenosine(37)-N6)-methyltransferase TrmO [Asgard group archaeon]|nr:tRNA (N6-threonylcarbamoyladenosine(37)-N6)-methyltransferase TrmO [Asgard group archaeon]